MKQVKLILKFIDKLNITNINSLTYSNQKDLDENDNGIYNAKNKLNNSNNILNKITKEEDLLILKTENEKEIKTSFKIEENFLNQRKLGKLYIN